MQVLVIDGSAYIGQRFAELLSEVPGVEHTQYATSYEGAITYLQESTGVVLLDLELPGNTSAMLLQHVIQILPQTIIIGLCSFSSQNLQKQNPAFTVHYLIDKYHQFEEVPQIVSTLMNSSQNYNAITDGSHPVD